jgi:hypothetical protein
MTHSTSTLAAVTSTVVAAGLACYIVLHRPTSQPPATPPAGGVTRNSAPSPRAPLGPSLVLPDPGTSAGPGSEQMALAQVAEWKRKIEVLLYMQEAVVNVMDFERVLEIIVDVAYSIVDADRLSVMVLSDDRKSMTIFESKDAKALTISSTTGVAGYVATTGEKVNIGDAYADPRFSPNVDKSTKFETRNILCVPVVAGGKIVGVIQAVNKRPCTRPEKGGGGPPAPFDSDDERGLEALSLSAGSAIRKAQL